MTRDFAVEKYVPTDPTHGRKSPLVKLQSAKEGDALEMVHTCDAQPEPSNHLVDRPFPVPSLHKPLGGQAFPVKHSDEQIFT